MDEATKEKYLSELAQEEQANIRQRNYELEQANSNLQASLSAQSFFLEKGVPVKELKLTGSYDDLVTSGWNYITSELARVKAELESKGTDKASEKKRKAAPEVDTSKNPTSGGSNWKSLIATYGSEENVYQLIEAGSLSPSILPE
jgi:hypothetical protein